MKKKLSKKEKQAAKLKRDYEKVVNLIGKDAADAMYLGILKKGLELNKISEEEFYAMLEEYGLKEGDLDAGEESV